MNRIVRWTLGGAFILAALAKAYKPAPFALTVEFLAGLAGLTPSDGLIRWLTVSMIAFETILGCAIVALPVQAHRPQPLPRYPAPQLLPRAKQLPLLVQPHRPPDRARPSCSLRPIAWNSARNRLPSALSVAPSVGLRPARRKS